MFAAISLLPAAALRVSAKPFGADAPAPWHAEDVQPLPSAESRIGWIVDAKTSASNAPMLDGVVLLLLLFPPLPLAPRSAAGGGGSQATKRASTPLAATQAAIDLRDVSSERLKPGGRGPRVGVRLSIVIALFRNGRAFARGAVRFGVTPGNNPVSLRSPMSVLDRASERKTVRPPERNDRAIE